MISLEDLNRTERFQHLDQRKQFLDLINRFAMQLDNDGISTIAYSEQSLMKLASMESLKVSRLYEAFSTYYDVIQNHWREENSVTNSKKILWKMCLRMGYRPCADLLDSISEGDVIEIYASDWVQTFRNMEFLDLCSYDLTSLFTHEFHELFQRPDAVNQYIFGLLNDVFLGKIQKTTQIGFEPHLLKEIHSPERLTFQIEPGVISPLKNHTGDIVAFVNTLRVKPITH
jgi:hypothetical protein